MSSQQTSQNSGRQTGPGSDEKAFIYSVNSSDSNEIEIDLGELLGVILHRLWLIILVALVCGIAGYCVSRFCIAETFESTTKIYVLDKSDTSTQSTYTELQTGSQLTNDYAEIITSRAVLEQVMSDNNLLDVYTYDQFLDKVEVDVPDSTRIVSITVTDTDPAMAQKLADDIRTTASELILETMEIDAVNTFEEANYPTEKAAPSNSRNAIIAAILGALLVIVVVVVRYLLDDTVKTSEDVERYLNLSTLALIPLDESLGEGTDKKGHKKRRKKENKKDKRKSGPDDDRAYGAADAQRMNSDLYYQDTDESAQDAFPNGSAMDTAERPESEPNGSRKSARAQQRASSQTSSGRGAQQRTSAGASSDRTTQTSSGGTSQQRTSSQTASDRNAQQRTSSQAAADKAVQRRASGNEASGSAAQQKTSSPTSPRSAKEKTSAPEPSEELSASSASKKDRAREKAQPVSGRTQKGAAQSETTPDSLGDTRRFMPDDKDYLSLDDILAEDDADDWDADA